MLLKKENPKSVFKIISLAANLDKFEPTDIGLHSSCLAETL